MSCFKSVIKSFVGFFSEPTVTLNSRFFKELINVCVCVGWLVVEPKSVSRSNRVLQGGTIVCSWWPIGGMCVAISWFRLANVLLYFFWYEWAIHLFLVTSLKPSDDDTITCSKLRKLLFGLWISHLL